MSQLTYNTVLNSSNCVTVTAVQICLESKSRRQWGASTQTMPKGEWVLVVQFLAEINTNAPTSFCCELPLQTSVSHGTVYVLDGSVCSLNVVHLPGGELGALRDELGLGASLELQASVWLKAPSSCRRLWIRLYSWRRFWKICSVGSKQEEGQKPKMDSKALTQICSNWGRVIRDASVLNQELAAHWSNTMSYIKIIWIHNSMIHLDSFKCLTSVAHDPSHPIVMTRVKSVRSP